MRELALGRIVCNHGENHNFAFRSARKQSRSLTLNLNYGFEFLVAMLLQQDDALLVFEFGWLALPCSSEPEIFFS